MPPTRGGARLGTVALAGHSIGGYLVRLYAAAHPEQVAGVVLIDSSHHEQFQRFAHYRAEILWRVVIERLRPYGLRRLAIDLGLVDEIGQQAGRRYPAEFAGTGVALSLSDRRHRADLWEMLAWSRLAAQTGRSAASLGQIPLTVVTSSELTPDCTTARQDADRRSWYPLWSELQRDLVRLSTDNFHLVAENAGHFVHRHDPDLVVKALVEHVHRGRHAR
ncbi:alpha/beta fold hydrolase [Planobispora longispora]|uniref:AB hydrolase-1 domain-containing protein n=1 Tax=Planobispora longispora TaxID=28887 RepID=A0A8J3W9B4_9ACTN|nr:alpha/beta hydrolase [Planobispora longispora]BFE88351.1 hypothetical protein GCM10020093_109520 [Planobispora longispora]GIH79666.1 hypothetical protein Plo01_60950 [Planobispora longispora]